jgi:GT2 family glycosyltransferase
VNTVTVVTPWRESVHLFDEWFECVQYADELIIIDNASRPGLRDHLCEQFSHAPHCNGQTRVLIHNDTNEWYAGACNQGIKESTSDIVICTNNDIAGDPDWIHQARLDVTPHTLMGPELITRTELKQKIPYIEGWCVAATRASWAELGGWNTWSMQGCYWEDCELSLRAVTMDFALAGAAWPVRHLGGDTTSSKTPGAYDYVDANYQAFLSYAAEVYGVERAS